MDFSVDMNTPVLSDPEATKKVEELVEEILSRFTEGDRVDLAAMALAAACVMSPGMRILDQRPMLLDMVNAAFEANGAEVRIVPMVTSRNGNRRRL